MNKEQQKINPNDGAFARAEWGEGVYTSHAQTGLTKREYFAALAMQGLVTRQGVNSICELGVSEADRIAEESVCIADKIIKELNK